MLCLVDVSGRLVLFCGEWEWGEGGAGAEGRWEGKTWGRGVSGNCSRNVIYNRIKSFQTKNKKQPIAWREGETKAT